MTASCDCEQTCTFCQNFGVVVLTGIEREPVTYTSAWTAPTGGECLVSVRGERSPEEMGALVAHLLPRRS